MAITGLKNDEKIFYDDLVSNIRTYTPNGDIASRLIEKLDDLLNEIIKNDESAEYNDWEF